MKKVFADLLARPGQFPRKNSLAVLTEVHLGPCVYAGLTPKCSHKLETLAAKSWKNLSVRMSAVYIIIVLAKKARIRGGRSSELSSRALRPISSDISDKSFSCYRTRATKPSNIFFSSRDRFAAAASCSASLLTFKTIYFALKVLLP